MDFWALPWKSLEWNYWSSEELVWNETFNDAEDAYSSLTFSKAGVGEICVVGSWVFGLDFQPCQRHQGWWACWGLASTTTLPTLRQICDWSHQRGWQIYGKGREGMAASLQPLWDGWIIDRIRHFCRISTSKGILAANIHKSWPALRIIHTYLEICSTFGWRLHAVHELERLAP